MYLTTTTLSLQPLALVLVSFNLWTSTALGQASLGDSEKSLFELPITQPQVTKKQTVYIPQKTGTFKTPRDSEGRFVKDTLLAVDAIRKEVHPEPGATEANLSFEISNPTQSPITITSILPSCGCTAAKAPKLPWTLNPGEKDQLKLTVNLREKYGILSKSVTVMSTAGRKFLSFKIHLPDLTKAQKANQRTMSARMSNIHKAMRNRQVVFQGHCRACHFDPCKGKKGEELFQAACGICHDTPNRASMVPDLESAPQGIDRNHDYWKTWITEGKEKTLMPAFHEKQGGPLNSNRIEILAAFLTSKYQQPGNEAKGKKP
jgi:hypothetical protein